ncbi:phosphoadenylylsulfate reductase (thioredoxin) [Pasteurella testudinis DSM 23072]|uniref:Adenosine 5'-phosphosulfate reductase n=1 Tax=Pasteurella testudinis DSM 23072 TaxID=1122938 RepID=A0A1W1UI94_9PAST|nr:phosphoadenylyl-sulfate reductase [Pasteurella testudinis]SMB80752.1 phosphoadenylylsulfate reductase (thioredoxin) [Pasteurella testudinis DSM 23072]SUB52318.1 Phosphoadenosine phosphosulfate reductase [Pasteurella testudinis]
MFKPNLWQIPQPQSAVLANLNVRIEDLQQRLQHIATQHQRVKFASSLAVEDMVITDMIVKSAVGIEIFTLETGRLNPETLTLLDQIEAFYPKLKLQRYYPQPQQVAQYVEQQGKDAFYQSIELRKQCCFIRKVEPLNRALRQADAWLTGQRREQSVTRTDLPFYETDGARQIAKYNPIFDWSEQDVWAYILTYQVPYNALYRQGYPSIGCEPCTRPVKAEEDIRAGRWWWENKDSKECGLHTGA